MWEEKVVSVADKTRRGLAAGQGGRNTAGSQSSDDG